MKTRYCIAIPDALYEELCKRAEARGIAIEALIGMIFKIGFVTLEIDQSPDADLMVRQGEETRVITLSEREL